MKKLWVLLLLPIFAACFDRDPESEKIQRLSVYMEQRYRRELHKDRFSINYLPQSNDTILIKIQFYPNANRQLINSLITSAREIIQRVGPTQFKVENVNIEVEMKELPLEGK